MLRGHESGPTQRATWRETLGDLACALVVIALLTLVLSFGTSPTDTTVKAQAAPTLASAAGGR